MWYTTYNIIITYLPVRKWSEHTRCQCFAVFSLTVFLLICRSHAVRLCVSIPFLLVFLASTVGIRKKRTPSSLELLLPQPTIQQKFTISADFLGRECQSSVFAAAHIVRQEGLRNFWWRHVAELNTISTSEGPSTKVLSCHYKYFARVLAVESVLENHETLQTQNNTVSIWL